MVFESLVVELMNKFLGAYIENLNASQLKLSIWSGDVVLENLHVKGDALKDLDLPVQIKFGHVGKLTLKIPWKNLYKEAVEATLDGLYLLAVPNEEVEYDSEKEEKREQEAKQTQLAAIEEQQLKSKKGPPDPKQDSFVEKLATQVVKNLQIHIKNIHVRYEDKVTIRNHPFAIGVTLHNLSFQTTNENWFPCLLDESVKIIYKMIDLQCLSVYWNPDIQTFLAESARDVQLNYFKSTIADPTREPENFNYIIQPITLQVKLRLNPHPENELSIPKIVLSVSLQSIGIRLLRVQYHSVMELAESMDRMVVNAPFRKFKPHVPIANNAALWWKYAYNSLLSTGVIIKAGQWSWETIKKHKQKIREYKELYKEKLQQKKASSKLQDNLLSMENNLDVFNITLARQTAEMELAKAGKKIKSKESVHQVESASSSSSWFGGGWFSKKKEPEKAAEPEKEGLDAVMSAKEKEDFYLAIGYSESEKFADMSGFDKSYVGLQLTVELKKVSLELADRSVSEKDLLSLNLVNVYSLIEQRPSADGLGVTAHISSLQVDGMLQGDIVPCLVSSNIGDQADSAEPAKQHLLTLLFEANPLDGACDQRVVIDSQPLQIIYDAKTVNSLLDFVKPPESVRLQQLRAVAASAYDDMKDQTATGLKHVMDTKSVIEIGIRLSSSFVVVPKTGFYSKGVECLVLDLGELSLQSANDGRTPMMKKPKVDRYAWMKQPEEDESLVLEEMREKVYDNFNIELRKIQLLHAYEGENWMATRSLSESPMHILQPLSIAVTLQKCMILNDAALPKIKISGEIPSLQLRMSDLKLRNILGLVESIPLPAITEEEKKVEIAVVESWTKDQSRTHLKVLSGTLVAGGSDVVGSTDDEFYSAESDLGSDNDGSPARKSPVARKKTSAEIQMTDIKLNFAIKEMVAIVAEELESGERKDLLTLRIGTFGLDLCGRTWDTTIDVFLESISVLLMQFSTPENEPLFLVDSAGSGGSEHLLKVQVVQVKKTSPEFKTIHNSTLQKIVVRFGTLRLGLHAPALLHLAKFGQKLAELQPQKPDTLPSIEAAEVSKLEPSSRRPSFVVSKAKTAAESEVINLMIDAQLDSIEIVVMDQTRRVTNLQIRNVYAGVSITDRFLKVDATLQGLSIRDAAPDTLYKDVISSVGQGDVLKLEFVNYVDATKGQEAFENLKNVDTSVQVRFGSTRIVFLNKFIQGLIEYAGHFSEFQEAAATAGTVAQEKAAAKAQELADSLQTSNPRILLDVSVTAPTVIVPTNSKSRDAIVADLGTISVANRFSGSSLENGFAVSDNMVVNLRNMKISKTTLTDDLTLGDETRILEEVTLSVHIIRNLSACWYHDVPDVQIHGRLPPISIKLSQPDLKSIMSVLDENLKEGQTEVSGKEIEKATPKTEAKKTAAKEAKKETAKPPTEVWETLNVDFQMDDVLLELFTDGDRVHSLSRLELIKLKTKVLMRNDQSLDLDFAFGELALEDTRAVSAGGITKLIRNITDAKDGSLVVAKVIQKADGSLEVDATVSSISIIISVEFLLQLAMFFTESLPVAAAVEKPAAISADEAASKPEKPAAEEAKPNEAEAEKSKAIKVTFKLEEPEIVLVTDVRSLDGEAITLGMLLKLNYDMVPDGSRHFVSADITNLHIDACAFKHVLHHTPFSSLTHKKVLAPCEVNFAGLMSDTKQDFAVRISDIRIKATPVIIHTLSDAVAQLTPPSKEEENVEEKKMREPLAVWNVKQIADMNLWFMKDSVVESLVDRLEEVDGAAVTKKEESAKIDLPLIQVTLESGTGHHTVPLLIAELTMGGNVSDWSCGELNGEVKITLGAAYFNDFLSVWEPLIEPNEVNPTSVEPTYEPWELEARIQQRKPTAQDEESAELPPLMSVKVESKHILQTTMSNAALKVIQELGIAFKDAALSKEFGEKQMKRRSQKVTHSDAVETGAAVVVLNQLGYEIGVDVGEAFRLVEDKPKTQTGYLLQNKATLLLDYREVGDSNLNSILLSQVHKLNSDTDFIFLRWKGGSICSIDISRACTTLNVLSSKNEKMYFVAEIETFAGIRNVTLRSHVVIYNKLECDIEVLKNGSGDADGNLGILPSKARFPVPPQLVAKNAVKLQPANGQLEGCILSWKEAIETTKSGFYSENYLKFAATAGSTRPVHFCVEFVEQKLDHAQDVTEFSQPGLNIYIRPTIVFNNSLPFSVDLAVQNPGYEGKFTAIDSGKEVQVLDADVSKSILRVNVGYKDLNWNSVFQHKASEQELSPWVFTDAKNSNNTLTLAKQIKQIDGVLYVTLYSPYWIVNKTGFPLDYKASDVKENAAAQHPKEGLDIALFSYTSKSFLSKNKLQLRVCNSNFSDSFSLDTVGSSGTITCKTKQFNYMVGMQSHLTSFTLTKMITFTSYFSFHNKSDLDVEISECNGVWWKVDAGKKIDIWPEEKEKFLVARLKGIDDSNSVKFRYDKLDSGVLIRLKDWALFVEVAVTEMSVEVSVRNYFEGATALLVVNDTKLLSFECWQGASGKRQTVDCGEAYHVIWSDPAEKREVKWSSSNGKEMSMDVFVDQASSFVVTESGKSIYYVLFGDGLQRVLLFTEDPGRAKVVEAQIRLERANLELELSLQGIACSLADSTSKREVAFVAITSSGLVWEEKPNKRWKPLAVKYSQLLESSYSRQLEGAPPDESLALDKYAFNLKTMKVTAPQERPLQRSFTPGLWVRFTSTSNQMTVHAKINRLQIDNQLPGAVFPVVFYPVPLPKSIAVDSSPKPFLEVSLMQRLNEQQSFMLIKYFKVLVQEFAVKLDMGFITGLLPVFGAEQLESTPEQRLKYFKKDVSLATTHEEIETSSTSVNFFDILHLSPIKVHVSFSMQNSLSSARTDGGGAAEVAKLPFSAFSAVLQSVGITLSDIDDVVFKLAYFERKYQFFSSAQFADAVVYHYAGQAIKQLYVLVFGLDVIGNPYGLVMGIAGGVTDLFYEPYQGIIQGPGEFFEGLGLGALSLLGHTVGGAAGAVSKVTGALGKGIASITMDEEYKRKRLEEKNKQPADIKEGLARGGKGLVMGVFSGITGVVTKPIEGAKQEGAAGFFKGVGKGLIGVVARPVSGVIDLASNTFEGIQKVADMSEDVKKIRPARWIDQHTGIIQPYSLKRAQGAAILEEIDQGKFLESNRYIDHVPLKKDRKAILMLTNKIVLAAHTGDILGNWKSDWKFTYAEIIGNVELSENTLKFSFKRRKKSSMKKIKIPDSTQSGTGLFGLGSSNSNSGPSFRPLSRGLSLGGSNNPLSVFSRRSLFRSNTATAAPSVKFTSDKSSVRVGGKSKEQQPQEQNKTRSIFGAKTGHETATFDDPKFAEYILKRINHYRRKALKGSFSSLDTSFVSSSSLKE